MANDGHFSSLEVDECQQLLRSASVGRVAWDAGAAGLLVLPVNYVWTEGRILFQTASDTLLAQLAEGRKVSFQIDFYDAEARNGWSVLVQGDSGLAGEEQLNLLPDPWAPGSRSLVVAISPRQFSGRAVSANDR
ncbi:MAG: pyridoxamine 5'-phosphate oxidase family protein [Propionibacteriaceae bacterium]|nr:pyridoxamine 5'-phosphate oxidase family protein [Propionibacteriaceae bacterium]